MTHEEASTILRQLALDAERILEAATIVHAEKPNRVIIENLYVPPLMKFVAVVRTDLASELPKPGTLS